MKTCVNDVLRVARRRVWSCAPAFPTMSNHMSDPMPNHVQPRPNHCKQDPLQLRSWLADTD
eukprot:12900439-Prorocentrum_lima.AAC.1